MGGGLGQWSRLSVIDKGWFPLKRWTFRHTHMLARSYRRTNRRQRRKTNFGDTRIEHKVRSITSCFMARSLFFVVRGFVWTCLSTCTNTSLSNKNSSYTGVGRDRNIQNPPSFLSQPWAKSTFAAAFLQRRHRRVVRFFFFSSNQNEWQHLQHPRQQRRSKSCRENRLLFFVLLRRRGSG